MPAVNVSLVQTTLHLEQNPKSIGNCALTKKAFGSGRDLPKPLYSFARRACPV